MPAQNKLFIDHYQNVDGEHTFYLLIRDSYKKRIMYYEYENQTMRMRYYIFDVD